MVVSIPKFTGPQIGAALSVVGGTMALMWAITGEKRGGGVRKGSGDGRSLRDSDSERAREKSRKDAMTVHPRPSVDEKTKDA